MKTIYGQVVPAFTDQVIGVKAMPCRSRDGTAVRAIHIANAYYMKEDGSRRPIGGGNVLLVAENSALELSFGYRDSRHTANVGFGVDIRTQKKIFVENFYFPASPTCSWAYGTIFADKDAKTLLVQAGSNIVGAQESWILTVTIWPILTWEIGGVATTVDAPDPGHSRNPVALNARHTRIIKEDRELRRDLSICLLTGNQDEVLARPPGGPGVSSSSAANSELVAEAAGLVSGAPWLASAP